MQGSGKTTQQLLQAPQRCYFVWCASNTYYPKKLAQLLGRNDIKVVSPDFLRNFVSIGAPIVIDHALVVDEYVRHRIELNNGRFNYVD